MAITADCTEWITEAACFNTTSINPQQQKALLVLFRVYEMAALTLGGVAGGKDYRNTMTTTLVSDALKACCGMTPDRRIAARIAVAVDRATKAQTIAALFTGSASALPTTLGAQILAANCLVQLPADTLDQMLLYLDTVLASMFYA